MIKMLAIKLTVALLSCFLVATQTSVVSAIDTSRMSDSLIAPGASLYCVSNRFEFTEGPATDSAGNVFFTDQPNNEIWKYTDGKLSLFLKNAGRSNGTYFDKQGNLVTCADEHHELWSIAPNGKITVLLKPGEGLVLNGPNDLWIDPHGGIYFTDPFYARSYQTNQSPENPSQNVYYFRLGKAPVVVCEDLKKPNGIIGTPDGKYLYVSDIAAGKTYRYNIRSNGHIDNKTVFVEQGSDGMTLDEQGNVYLTGKGVTIYNAAGKQVKHINVPEEWTGNVTFGGRERNLLFITASHGVYTLKMNVKGARF
jgi:gluconolactonase